MTVLGGGIISRTPSNSAQCIAQMIIRIKPVMEKALRFIKKGKAEDILNIIHDLRTQILENNDVDGDPFVQAIVQDPSQPYSIFDAYEVLAYKISMAFRNNVLPEYMPLFYIHFSKGEIIPYYTLSVSEPGKISELLINDMRKSKKTFMKFDSLSISSQMFFIKIDRPNTDQSLPITLTESIDLREFGGERYQLFVYFYTKIVGKTNQVVCIIRDKKGWIIVDSEDVYSPDNFMLIAQSNNRSSPVIFVGYIQGSSNIETIRPGAPLTKSGLSKSLLSFGIKSADFEESNLDQTDESSHQGTRMLRQKSFDPCNMVFNDLPSLEFESKEDFKSRVGSLQTVMQSKGFESSICYRAPGDRYFVTERPKSIPDNIEVLADLSLSVDFVNDFMENPPIKVILTMISEKPVSIAGYFYRSQLISDVRDYINYAVEQVLELVHSDKRHIYYQQDDGLYMIADDSHHINKYPNRHFFFTPDGEHPYGANVLNIKFVETNPTYSAVIKPVSINTTMTVEDLRDWARCKVGFATIDFYTFREHEPDLYLFPPIPSKNNEGEVLLSPLGCFTLQTNLFVQHSLSNEHDTAVISYVIVESFEPLVFTGDAFRLAFKTMTKFRKILMKTEKVLQKKIKQYKFVVKKKKLPVNSDMLAKDLTKGVCFISVSNK